MLRQILLPTLLLLFAMATYLWRINDKSVDFDERYTLNIATGLGGNTHGKRTFGTFVQNPIAGKTFTPADYWGRFTYANTVNTALSDNGQGLPYFLLLHGWFATAPVTVFNARLPAVLFLVLTGALLWVFLRRNAPPRLAWLATTLLLFNGLLMDLARYSRFYTLGIFLALLSGIVLYKLVQHKRPATAFLLGCVWTVFFLTQYFAALVILGQGLYLLFHERKKVSVPVWTAGVAGVLILIFLWLIPLNGIEALLSVFRYHEQSAQSKTAWFATLTTQQALIGLGTNLATLFGAATNPQPGFKAVFNILLALPGWALCLRVLRQPLPEFQRFWVRIAALIIATQTVFVISHLLFTSKGLLLVPRYWMFCIPFGALWLAIGINSGLQEKGNWRLLAVVAVIALGLRLCLSIYTAWSGKGFNGFSKPKCLSAAATPDIEGMATAIRQRWRPGDTVVYARWSFAQYINWFWQDAPPIVQQVDSTQPDFARIKTPSGVVTVPLRLGQPAKARPCP